MSKELIYKMYIGAFKPKTIPMSRLSEYMADFAGLLGEKKSVHFARLDEGSTILSAMVEVEAQPKVTERIATLERGDSADDLRKYFDALDKHLADDNATGTLRAYLDGNEEGAVVIQFPGCERPKKIDYGLISERGSLDGIPISIGGKDKTKHIILNDGDRSYTGIELNTDLAAKISDDKCLFRKVIRLHGVGNWYRTSDGDWELKKFKVDNYEVLEDTPLAETLNQLHAINGSGWSEEEHAAEYLEGLRNNPDESQH